MFSQKLIPKDHREISKGRFFVGDRAVWWLYFFFLMTSILSVVSASSNEVYKYYSSGAGTNPIVKHILYAFLGGGTVFLVSRFPPAWFRTKMLWYSAVVLLMIVALPFIGIELNEAKRWINLGVITLQPSEFFKLCLIIWGAVAGAKAYASPEHSAKCFKFYWFVSLGVIVFLGMENFSTGIMFLLFVLIFSFVIRAPKRLMAWAVLLSFLGGALLAFALYVLPAPVLKEMHPRAVTWKNRLTNTVAEQEDSFAITDNNRQEQYGKIALANSEFFGMGMGKSKVKEILPMANSDFIYAIIIEEYGIIGMLFIPGLYVMWFILAGKMARREKNKYRSFLLLGIGLLFPLQALINIAVVSGAFMTGQPLPLISAGGSSMIVGSLAFGIMLSISNVQQAVRELENKAQKQGVELIDKQA